MPGRSRGRRTGEKQPHKTVADIYEKLCAKNRLAEEMMSYVVDHPILDRIARRVNNLIGQIELRRESECLEFRDKDGKWYEIVVRPIDGPSTETAGR